MKDMALLTDLYQLTMAYGYWKTGKATCDATFHLFFRKNPFGGEYAVACGLGTVLEFLKDFRFYESDLEFLEGVLGSDGIRRSTHRRSCLPR